MSLHKKTVRKLPPVTRELAKNINAAETYLRRIKRLLDKFSRLESEVMAWDNRQKSYREKGLIDPLSLD